MSTTTATQSRKVIRLVEFSVNTDVSRIDRAFPSVTFFRKCSNGGVTVEYELSGPCVWIDKIERMFGY